MIINGYNALTLNPDEKMCRDGLRTSKCVAGGSPFNRTLGIVLGFRMDGKQSATLVGSLPSKSC